MCGLNPGSTIGCIRRCRRCSFIPMFERGSCRIEAVRPGRRSEEAEMSGGIAHDRGVPCRMASLRRRAWTQAAWPTPRRRTSGRRAGRDSPRARSSPPNPSVHRMTFLGDRVGEVRRAERNATPRDTLTAEGRRCRFSAPPDLIRFLWRRFWAAGRCRQTNLDGQGGRPWRFLEDPY